MKSHRPTGSYLRMFQALPTSESFDFYLDEMKYAKDILYQDFTPYKPLEPGEHLFKVCAHQSTEPLYERSLWMGDGKIYTLVLAHPPNTSTMQGYLINEPPKAIPEEHFLMRVANFSTQTTPMCLHLVETKPIFKKVPLRQCGSYLGFVPTTAAIELLDVSSQDLLLEIPPLIFKPYRYYTLYLVGGTEHNPLKCIRTIDGNSFLAFEDMP